MVKIIWRKWVLEAGEKKLHIYAWRFILKKAKFLYGLYSLWNLSTEYILEVRKSEFMLIKGENG